MNITTILIIVFSSAVMAVLGIVIGWMIRKKTSEDKIASAEQVAKKLLTDAEKQVEAKKKEAIIEAKEELYKAKQQFESETKERRVEIQNLEKRLVQREEHVDKKVDLLDQKEKEYKTRENELIQKDKILKDKDDKLNKMIEDERVKLEKISGLTTESAKKMLLEMLEKQAHHDAAAIIKRIEDEAKEEAEKKAKKIISLAIQRCSIDHTVESTVSVVPLPNEEMKGRVIGREGRNIRALEAATGIDVIVDDTPEAVVLSGFDMVRREIARISLERLISDGRIHPTRIEEVVERVKSEVEEKIKETGERTVLDMGLSGIHPELVRLIGRLKYRTSYGQNILQHSIEVANMAGMLAGELGLDTVMFKRAGLLHDIGKAVDHEIEGTHPQIGADLVKKYKMRTQSFNMIGLPEDTKETIFETIRMNKSLQPDRILCTIYMPFKGTELGRRCIEEGLVLRPVEESNGYYTEVTIKNYYLKPRTLIGYQGFFDWYVRLPEKYYWAVDILRLIYQTILPTTQAVPGPVRYFREQVIEFVYGLKGYLPNHTYVIKNR